MQPELTLITAAHELLWGAHIVDGWPVKATFHIHVGCSGCK